MHDRPDPRAPGGGSRPVAEELPKVSRALPPVMVALAALDGAEVQIDDARPLVVNVPEPEQWLGGVSDPDVAEFIPGEDDGAVVFNPGFEVRGAGVARASLIAPDGTRYTFTLIVR